MKILSKKPAKAKYFGLIHPGPRKEITEACGEHENNYQLMGNVGNIICIDPGLNGTGWAVFDREDGPIRFPIASGSISVERKKHPWWTECKIIAELIRNQMQHYGCFGVYIELPKFFESAGAGMSAARDGDLVRLSVLTGMIFGACSSQMLVSSIVPVAITDWKGQLPKEMCNDRVVKKLRTVYPKWKPSTNTTHELDAIGIGLFVKGWF
jgi:hypothetical protein